jgi:hypothetical protein
MHQIAQLNAEIKEQRKGTQFVSCLFGESHYILELREKFSSGQRMSIDYCTWEGMALKHTVPLI